MTTIKKAAPLRLFTISVTQNSRPTPHEKPATYEYKIRNRALTRHYYTRRQESHLRGSTYGFSTQRIFEDKSVYVACI
jgi:hypothetical protein